MCVFRDYCGWPQRGRERQQKTVNSKCLLSHPAQRMSSLVSQRWIYTKCLTKYDGVILKGFSIPSIFQKIMLIMINCCSVAFFSVQNNPLRTESNNRSHPVPNRRISGAILGLAEEDAQRFCYTVLFHTIVACSIP